MKIFIDTSNQNLFIGLVNNNKMINHIEIKDLKQKADNLPITFKELLDGKPIADIKDFYITLGPGSFTGSRVALMFTRTICQITNAKLHTINSLKLIHLLTNQKKVYIDARSGLSYFGCFDNDKIELVPYQESTKFSYQELINHPDSLFNKFKIENNLLEIKPYYFKDPQIGGK
jgi:tRNA threonylcarbamoyl adenosine modification protein YeaZ